MVLCFIALPVLLIFGVFSVKYRKLALEAFQCAFRAVTLRKCQSNFDEKLKGYITGKLIKKSPKFGLLIYRNFQIISLIFVIILVLSAYFAVDGFINYRKYGNCYGLGNDDFCVYDVLLNGNNSNCTSPETCTNELCNCDFGGECICDNEDCLAQQSKNKL